jgi:hypothetical protein
MKLINFDECRRIPTRGYRGNAGRKQAYLYDRTMDGEIPAKHKRFKGSTSSILHFKSAQ